MKKEENNSDNDLNKSAQADGIFPTAEYTALYARIKNEIIEHSTDEVAKAFADSQHQAASGNYMAAIQLINSLALSGNVYAQMLLYEYYSHLDQHKDAIMWLQRASKQHHPYADFLLGAAYTANKEGLEKNIRLGQALLVKSAKKGLVDAQFVLGIWGIKAYSQGGDKRQYDMAIKMLRMAADQNYLPAIDKLKELNISL
jgi:TPR repeat protein